VSIVSILGCLIITCCSCIISNKKWAKRETIELEKSIKIAQTAKGPIEYKVFGQAPYMVFMAGTPGLVHLHLEMKTKFHDFGVITVSRPGYCRTPLTTENKTAVEQADLVFALMDFLNIDKFVVYGCSGAGPVALNMALKDPKRVKALMLGCAVTGDYKHKALEWLTGITGFLLNWAMASPTILRMVTYQMENNPKSMVKDMLRDEALWDDKELTKQT
jgi:pimeloyl-ACP methyl ester carboxylesterase